MEIWRDIPGYEGKYQVSNLGRVKSLNYNNTGKEQIMKLIKGKTRYLNVQLYKKGKIYNHYVHRLVAEAFIHNPDNLPQVNHKDENKENNRVDNLELCTCKYNINYGTARERITKKLINREDLSKKVLCVETGKLYPSAMEAERLIKVRHQNIIACCRGKLKIAGGYHWQYAENNENQQ